MSDLRENVIAWQLGWAASRDLPPAHPVARGVTYLREMHETLNAGFLEHDEQYELHPHVTLAQGLTPGTVDKSFCEAKGRWNKAAPARRVHISNVTFVQNTTANIWLDLNEFLLPERS